jgi:hypothetical protein
MARVRTTKRVLMILNIVALVGLTTSTTVLFLKNKDLNEQVGLTSEEQNKRLVAEINEVYDLPDEEPVVAKVTDADEFKKQYAVFDNAQVGDYLLFFRKARLNVLYRQSDKKVVKTADVVVPITVELIGSEAAMSAAEEALKEFGNQITVVKTKTDGITQSFVFDVDQDQKEETDSVAKQLSYEVGTTLPAGFTPGAQTEIVVAVSSAGSSTQPVSSTPDPATTAEQQP